MSILNDIIDQKKREIAALKASTLLESRTTLVRSLYDALDRSSGLSLIAELKQASPSKGLIYDSFNPKQLARRFEQSGATGLSVLTDQVFFKGHSDYLRRAKAVTQLPILRKDFILDPIQIQESYAMEADAVLIILDILTTNQANELIEVAQGLGLGVLLEIHGDEALHRLSDISSAPIVGINNRDLHSFDCDIDRALSLAPQIRNMHPGCRLIAESGYSKGAQLVTIQHHGFDGILIGEGLKKNSNMLAWFSNEN